MRNFFNAVVIVFGLIIVNPLFAKSKNGCKLDGQGNPNVANQTIIVFDSSDPYMFGRDQNQIKQKIASIMNQLQIFIQDKEDSGHIVSFWHFGLKTGFEKNEPTNFICLIGKPGFLNRPPEITLKNMKKKELSLVEKFLNDMYYDPEEKGATPLIDSLITILDSPWLDLTTKGNQRELILISDLLENSAKYQFYEKDYWKKNPPKELAKLVLDANPLNLRRMPVSVYFIKRKEILDKQGAELEQFWTELFVGWKAGSNLSFRQIR